MSKYLVLIYLTGKLAKYSQLIRIPDHLARPEWEELNLPELNSIQELER